MTATLIALAWIGAGAFGWAAFLDVAAKVSAYRAQRTAEREAWNRAQRAERRLRRLMRDMWRGPVKPSAIAISFHALTDDCAVERLLSRLHPVGARPSPESE